MPTATASISVEDAVNRRRGDLVELSHSIHAEPELAFAEHRSCAKTRALVADYGFEITAAPGGLDTAFRADYGSGPLVVGVCAEYDALPGIGHACGHNIIAASAVGLLRQQLVPGQMVHGIVTDGGQATNVIPARAEMQYTMRANDAASLRELEGRMADCFLAGAVATGCEYRVRETEPPYDELAPDQWLADTFRAEMVRLGRTPVARDVEAAMPLGSTDMGNVTQVIPGIHPIVGIDANGASVHQPAFAAAAAGPSADKAVVEGAIMLARTVVSLAETAAERDRVLGLLARRAS